jgi:hypothetical protein
MARGAPRDDLRRTPPLRNPCSACGPVTEKVWMLFTEPYLLMGGRACVISLDYGFADHALGRSSSVPCRWCAANTSSREQMPAFVRFGVACAERRKIISPRGFPSP